MIELESSILSNNGKPIYFTTTLPIDLNPGSHPIVMLLHGFKGFRNWGFFPHSANVLAENNFLAIRLDFSLNGMRGTSDRVVAEDDFRINTISQEVDDALTMAMWLEENHDKEAWLSSWNGVVHLVGHSRGGGVAQVVFSELLNSSAISRDASSHSTFSLGRCIVWNSIGRWQRWSKRMLENWEATGEMEVENSRTGQKLKMGYGVVLDYIKHKERLDLISAAKNISSRTLYIHAEADVTVNIREIQDLISHTRPRAELIAIPSSNHTFGVSHPFSGFTPALTTVLNKTVGFLKT